MTPFQAANEYFRLEAISVSNAIAFAHSYEDTASAEDFDAYLDALDVIAERNATQQNKTEMPTWIIWRASNCLGAFGGTYKAAEQFAFEQHGIGCSIVRE